MVSAEERITLFIVSDTLGWISFLLNAFILIGYSLDPASRKYPSNIFLFSIIPVVIQSFGVPFGTMAGRPALSPYPSPLCTVQGVIIHYGFFSWNVWVCLMTVQLYILVVLSRVSLNPRRTMIKFLVIGFGVPLIPVIANLAAGKYAPGSTWCFISAEDYGVWVLATHYFWVTLNALGCSVVLGITIYKIAKTNRHGQQNPDQADIRARNRITSMQTRLVIFLALFLVIILAGAIVRIRQIILRNLGITEVLDFAASVTLLISASLTGFLHLFAFGTNSTPYNFLCVLKKPFKAKKSRRNNLALEENVNRDIPA